MPDVVPLVLSLALVGLVVYALAQMYRSAEPAPPLDAEGWTVVVDGSNFAHWSEDDVQLQYLLQVVEELEHRFQHADLRVYCDANLTYKFDDEDRDTFENLLRDAPPHLTFEETHGREADDAILEYAQNHLRTIVVSNDRFDKGDEIERRIDVPLLQVERNPPAVRLADQVDVYRDHERAAKVSVDELIESG
jgi:rRNA-processing protein FCF1